MTQTNLDMGMPCSSHGYYKVNIWNKGIVLYELSYGAKTSFIVAALMICIGNRALILSSIDGCHNFYYCITDYIMALPIYACGTIIRANQVIKL